jgi:glycosyltransferase involved in cell wall biosynthesis
MGNILNKSVKDILFVTVGYTLGGSEKMIARIAPRLKTRGYKIRVLAFKNWGPISEELINNNIECLSLQGVGKFDLRVLWRYFLYLKKAPPDLIIAFLYRAYIPTRIIGYLLNIPNISSVRDVEKWMNPFHIFLEKITSKLSISIYSCSNAVTKFLLKEIGIKKERIVTIPNGIDVDAYYIKINREEKLRELGIRKNTKVVSAVCRLHEPKKGVKVLLNATRIIQEDIDFHLLIVGTGKDEKKLKEMAIKEKINAHFLGERKDIKEILQITDIFVLPSLYEGFPVAVLEAMAVGVPIVATRVGGLTEAIINKQTGFLVEPGNPAELAEKIKELLLNKQLRQNFGEAGLNRVKEVFSLDKTVERIEYIWKGAVK